MRDDAGRGRSGDAADFLDFTAARQTPVLRAATIVCRDAALSEQVALRTFAALAADWSTVREEGPDGHLRRRLYRDAVAAVVRREAGGASAVATAPQPATDPCSDHDLDPRRAATQRVLDALPARARAVAALRWLDDRSDDDAAVLLEEDVEEVRADVATVRTRLGAVDAIPGGPPASDDEARDLLELVADQVPDVDLGPAALAAARARTRTVRRRGVVVSGLVVAAGAAGYALRPDDPGPGPGPVPSPSVTDGRLRAVPVAGATVLLAPTPDEEERLPLYPDAASLALPRRLGPGDTRPLEVFSPAGSQAAVRAVYLMRVSADRYQPAIVLPRQSPAAQIVSIAPLRPTVDVEGNAAGGLGPRSIDGDRHRIVFPQPGAVVVLEVRSARARRIAVRDEGLTSAGWAADGRTVVARSDTVGWLVDTVTGKATRSGGAVHPGWSDIDSSGGATTLRSYSGDGRLVGLRSLEGPELDVHGASVSNIEGWACRSAFFGELRVAGGRMQGLVAVQGDLRPTPRILAASLVPGVPLAPYRPLIWGPRDTVLFESTSYSPAGPSVRVLAWDVVEDRLYRVADVDLPDGGESNDQAYTGIWAL